VYLEIVTPFGAPVSEFRYLWGRHVTGFDPACHCAACLLGRADPAVKPGLQPGRVDLLDVPADAFYLCGVAWNHRLTSNMHLVVEQAPGEIAEVTSASGVRFRLHGARALPIPALPPGWNGLPRLFTRCRNFQWAVSRYGYHPRNA
jgi:hypothetical protein